jgi:hypothetical protein
VAERLAFVEPISMEQFARFAEEQGWPAGDEPVNPDGDIDEASSDAGLAYSLW